MTFKDAIDQTPYLKGQWQPGLGALRSQDRNHIQPETPRKLTGSVDIDNALKSLKAHAQANRWDFAIGFKHDNRTNELIYWVETHSGSDNQIRVMLAKLEWLKNWLKSEGKLLAQFECDFVWVPSGRTRFTQGSQQVRVLAQKGLIYAGSGLKIPDSYPA